MNDMLQSVVQLGAEKIIISAETFPELAKLTSDLKLMGYRLRHATDAVFRYRKNDGGEFVEFYSPSMKATLYASKEMEGGEWYIDAKTPWVRFDSENDATEVRYSWIGPDLEKLGWTKEDENKFVAAEKCKTEGNKGKQRAWTYRPLR